jgi:hypothetical protein
MPSGHVGGHDIVVDEQERKKLCLSICGLILTTGDNFVTLNCISTCAILVLQKSSLIYCFIDLIRNTY